MRSSLKNPTCPVRLVPTHEQGSARTVLLVVLGLLVGLGLGAFWHYRSAQASSEVGAIRLSEGTLTALRNLSSPVEIHFYSLLDAASSPAALRAFATRADQLVAEYQRAAGGKIVVTRQDAPSDSAANAATADGLKAFNLAQGDACFLGIAVVQGTRKESLAQLSPDWEAALESDLTRTILRLNQVAAPAKTSPADVALETAASEEVKQKLPDPAAVSLEDGRMLLRDSGVKEFQALTKETERQLQAAQLRLQQVQNGGTEAELQAAREELRKIQTESVAKLQQIAARIQAQVTAWERLKGTPAP